MAPKAERRERLRDLQSRFLADLAGTRSRSAGERAAVFRAPPLGTVETRWTVYTSGYLTRLVETIGHDYPAVRRVLGERAWRSLVARYVRTCPPGSHDVADAGRRLAAFLDADPLGEDLPFLADLARFEAALAAAFVAPDVPVLTWDEFRARGPEAASVQPLRAIPGTTVIHSDWPLGDLKKLVGVPDEAVDLEVAGRPTTLLVWRREWVSRWRELKPAEPTIAEAIVAGTTLTEMLERSTGGADPGTADVLLATVRRFVGDGVVQKPVSKRRSEHP